jgi:small subunit ribosomal protein S1
MPEASEAQGPDGATSSQAAGTETAGDAFARTTSGEVSAAEPSESTSQGALASVAQTSPSESGSLDAASMKRGPEEQAAEGEHAEDAADGEAEPGDAASAATADAGGEAGTGKRKRRRRKKHKGEGGEQEPAGEEHAETRSRKRDMPPAPLARFFVGAHAGRKHGFAVEEVVAGRVKEIANGSITVDLFGKALAYADEFEPREAPPPRKPEPPPEPVVEATASASAQAPSADASSEVSLDAAPLTAVEGGNESIADHASASDGALAAATDEAAHDAEHHALESEAGASASDAGSDNGDGGDSADGDDGDVGEATLSGEAGPSGHGPLPPAPVVPESFPRLDPPTLGAVFRGRVGAVSESGHIAIVNRDVDRQAVLANLKRYRDDRRRVQGLVFGFNRGGFDVIVEGVRAFCPASAMSLDEIDDPAQLLGHKLEFLLPASQSIGKDVVVSRRSILERQLRKKAKELVRSLEPGQRLKGRVTQVREFGVFVDIGGVEGLVHQSELSFAHGVKPSDVAAIGDEVEVQVLRVGGEPRKGAEGGRRDRVERVSLSIKALLPDPWDAHSATLKEGGALLGKVTRTTEFGAFIELVPHVEGLLHVTELGRDLKHANQAVREGDEIPVLIERLDKQARRISLSKLTAQELEEYKSFAAAGEEPPRSVKPGSRIKVKVSRVEGRGLIVRVSGVLGKRARGYLPTSELAGDRGDLRKSYPIGSELEVKIVGLDRDGGLRCSQKALEVDDERRAVKDYRREAAKQGFGTFGDLLRAKLGQADSK